MTADRRGTLTLARLLAGLPLSPQELDGRRSPGAASPTRRRASARPRRRVNAALGDARAAGLSPRTVRRARESLGIRPRKDSFRGCWLWALPTRCPLPSRAGHQDAG